MNLVKFSDRVSFTSLRDDGIKFTVVDASQAVVMLVTAERVGQYVIVVNIYDRKWILLEVD